MDEITTNLYIVDGELVVANKSEGGLFYNLSVIKTGKEMRYPAKAFEAVAKPVKADSAAKAISEALK
jgi:hypothetical protein